MTREMKDSGVEWIGEIPREWEVKRVKSCISDRTAGNWGEDEKNNEDDFICIRVADFDYERMRIKKANNYTKRNYNKAIVKKLLLKENDILIEKSGGGEKTPVGRTIIFKEKFPALYANFIERLRVNFNIVNPMFLQYLFVTFYKNKYILNYIKQTTGIQNLDITSMLTNERVVLPPLEEQEKIANYLDKKVSDIDLIIEKTKATIEDYKKYKQSIITEAVTKGINPNVEMKDSGIEWIGEIPREWEVKKLKYLLNSSLQYGANETGIQFDNQLPRYIRITDILANNNLKEEGKLSLTEIMAKEFILNEGDLLFARSGGTVGKTFLYQSKFGRCAFAGYLIRANVNNKIMNSKFLYYYTLSSCYEIWKNNIFIQSTIQNIGADKYSNLLITTPPLEEQNQIAEYLDKKTSEIDTLITKKEALIAKLEEYKKSLIYECVTGKKEIK